MSEQLVFKDCRTGIKQVISDYWARKWPRLERLLSTYRPGLRHLKMQVSQNSGNYETHLVLSLPTGTLRAHWRSKNHFEALDLAVDKLVAELRRHKEQIRHEEYRRGRLRAEFGARDVA